MAHIRAVNGDAAAAGREITGQGVQQGRLAGAVGADNADELTGVHRQAHARQCCLLQRRPLGKISNHYSPINHSNRARILQREILDQMVDLGYVNHEKADSSYQIFWDTYDYTRSNDTSTQDICGQKIEIVPSKSETLEGAGTPTEKSLFPAYPC